MNLFNKAFIIGLIISILPTSCTIEKRVHRKGYHFEWKRQNQTLTLIEFNAKRNTSNTEEGKRLTEIQNEDNLALIYKNINRHIKETQTCVENKHSDKKIIIPLNLNRYKIENSVFTKKVKKISIKSDNTLMNPYKADHERMKGVLMMIAALLLFGLGYVFFLYLGAFGLILFWIFGIGSAIIFLLGLLYTIFG